MKIQLVHTYTIEADITSAKFIQLVDQMMMFYDNKLDSLDMGDAVAAAVKLYQNDELQPKEIKIELTDFEYRYIDCPDKSTMLDFDIDLGVYSIIPGTNDPEYKSPYRIARDAIVQDREVVTCANCRKYRPNCIDNGEYSGWVCSTRLDELMALHFEGKNIAFFDIKNHPAVTTLKGYQS